MRRMIIAVLLLAITLGLLFVATTTYRSVNTPSDVEVTQDGGLLTFSVNADVNTSVDWEISDVMNTAAQHRMLSGHTATVSLDPGRYSVTCTITDLKGGVRSVSDTISVQGAVDRTFSWTYDGQPCIITYTMDYSDVETYYNKSVSRGVSKETDIYQYIVVDENTRRLADKMMDSYTLITGMAPVIDSADYAQFVLSFCQDAIEYVTDSSSRGQSEYWKFPLETLYDSNGDCEDTSILFASILSASGYSSVGVFLMPSHALGAVALDDYTPQGNGTLVSSERNGHMYYAAETTSSSWSIGYTSSSFLDSIPLLYVGHQELI
ncbi:MAG: hypothetical protein IJT54_08845 [Candidatus Methanomethylophilaceae archaeon]|nr:hypothetical protein [Candidatus Methanomethylophilaceae archaeon]